MALRSGMGRPRRAAQALSYARNSLPRMTEGSTTARAIVSEQIEIVVDADPASSAMGAYLGRPAAPATYPAVIVAHELFGVTAEIRGITDRIAELGYIAVAPAFYHRTAAPGTELTRDEDGRARGFELMGRLTRDQAVQDVDATLRYLSSRHDTTGQTAMVGFSLGGHIAYLAATELDLAATVVLYGGWIPTRDIPLSRPEPTITLTRGIADHGGRLLFLVGEEDHLIPAGQRRELEDALTAAHVPHELVVYPDTPHAFFWEGTDTFRRASRDDAWRRVRELLAAELAPHQPNRG